MYLKIQTILVICSVIIIVSLGQNLINFSPQEGTENQNKNNKVISFLGQILFQYGTGALQKMFLLGLQNVRIFRTWQFFGVNFLKNTQIAQISHMNDTSMCSLLRMQQLLPDIFNIEFKVCPENTIFGTHAKVPNTLKHECQSLNIMFKL